VFQCAPRRVCFLLSQQKPLSSCELAFALVGGGIDGLPKKKSGFSETNLQLPPQTRSFGNALFQPAAVASTALFSPRPPCPPRSSLCHLECWLASLLLGACLLGVASPEAAERGMAEVGRREPGRNSSLRSTTVPFSQPPPPSETA